MGQDLEKLVDERKVEAGVKNIFGKAYMIARYLGSGTLQSDYRNLKFENDSFYIEDKFESNPSGDIDMGDIISGRTTIKYEGKVVFDYHNCKIESYIPGVWEKEFEGLYSKADRKQKIELAKAKKEEQNAKREVKRKENSELRKNFGL